MISNAQYMCIIDCIKYEIFLVNLSTFYFVIKNKIKYLENYTIFKKKGFNRKRSALLVSVTNYS